MTHLPFEQCQKLAQSLERGKATGFCKLSHEQILRIAARRGFSVSRQYRQDNNRRKARKLKDLGLLTGGRGKNYGDGHSYKATPAGLCVLGIMERLK